MARKNSQEHAKHTGETIPTYARLLLGLFIVVIAFFNLKIAPSELATRGMFDSVRQPQNGLFILCIVDVCVAAIAFALLILGRWLKVVTIVTILLIILSAYAWFAGITA